MVLMVPLSFNFSHLLRVHHLLCPIGMQQPLHGTKTSISPTLLKPGGKGEGLLRRHSDSPYHSRQTSREYVAPGNPRAIHGIPAMGSIPVNPSRSSTSGLAIWQLIVEEPDGADVLVQAMQYRSVESVGQTCCRSVAWLFSDRKNLSDAGIPQSHHRFYPADGNGVTLDRYNPSPF